MLELKSKAKPKALPKPVKRGLVDTERIVKHLRTNEEPAHPKEWAETGWDKPHWKNCVSEETKKKKAEAKYTSRASAAGSSTDQVAIGVSPIASVGWKDPEGKGTHAGACSSIKPGVQSSRAGARSSAAPEKKESFEDRWNAADQTASRVSAKPPKPKYCFRYQRDGCKFGEDCPYLHELKSTPSKAAPRSSQSSGDLHHLMVGSSGKPQGERLDLTVDSGAAVSAIPRDAAKGFPTVQEAEPKNYTSASGHSVTTLGSKRTQLQFQNGTTGAVDFQVMDVPKPLLSVSKVLKKGYRVVFDTECSYIENKSTGLWYKLYERGGVFVLPTWLCCPNGGQAAKP